MLLVLAKNLLFDACLRQERPYVAVKGRLVRMAARAGFYEREYMRLVPALVRPGSQAIDIGANAGAYTHALARAAGTLGQVVAFEPIPSVADDLERSCRPLGNVVVLRALLSDRTATAVDLRIPRLPGGVPEPALATAEASSAEHTEHGRRAVRARIVCSPATRLDDHKARFRDVSFIKIDVEGHEAAVLSGATAVVRTFRPVLQIEAAGLQRHEAVVRSWIEANRYDVYVIEGGQLSPHDSCGVLPLNVYLIPRHPPCPLPATLFRDTGPAR